ncbi:NACHT domain-containing protein [Leptolyngbya sp. CCNP1308]|uniref:NACHT domain-containing protein n=1 Tax=Leptolyngbya sp. CCNP1308 TaxID=3110255 RepID=UPI002B1F851D|nr:NACHT domain-containing protein [Leptolyngbya sp. CCNP1308]MEA5450615.1 NACHT domain-containing protein [Leptolyngbya sp. CCNP1308]
MSHCRKTFSYQGLAGLFALTLTLSVIYGSYLPGYSQSSPLPPREALEAQIRNDVKRHLDIREEPLSHSDIERSYSEAAEAAEISYSALIQLYEEEYAEQKAAIKPSPWEQFFPNAGWFFGFLALGIAAYVTVLKKWLEARYQAIGNWVYQRLSGTRLFRNVALRKYRAALVQNYQHLPMPFLKNRDPLNMSEVYVPLKVSDIRQGKQPDLDGIDTKHESTDALKAIANHRRLMVIGEPGSGKSVLLKYLAWAYGLGELDTLAERPTVVLLELYRLSDASLNETKLIQALVDTFDRNQLPNAQNLVRQGLDSGTLMLLLDGLDEVNSGVRPHVVGVIRDLLRKFGQCQAVITCRTQVYEDEFSDIVDHKLEVVEFTDQQMRRFLKAWEPEMEQARKSINQMMAALRERPLILKLARNPLLLTLIAYLYTEPAFVLPRSRAEFYDKSTGILLEQREYKGDDDYKHNRYEPNEKRRVLQHLALYTQDHSAELQDRRSLKAEIVREQVRQVLPSLDIPEEKAKDILDEIAERSGLFMKIDGGERYLFPHLTIQEYFAAAALNDREPELVSRFVSDPTAWREVVKLWCSLANDSSSLVAAVYRQDPITSLECLAEARQVDQALASQIIDHFQKELDQPQADDTLSRAFGAVAANDRSRGKAVFVFLEDTLLNPQASDGRRAFAAEALSRTNLPKAATVLIHWDQDSQPIVRMGDLAVPGLSKLAQKGVLKALDDLYAIATPDAATALVPLLWSEHDVVKGRAAWYLSGLLTQPDIEETLRDYLLTSQQRQSETLSWIWQPFGEPATSALPIIAGRIAYALQLSQQNLSKTIPNIDPTLDPRLIVPLCTIVLKPSQLPDAFPLEATALLEQPGQTPELAIQCSTIVRQLLNTLHHADGQWELLVSRLNPITEQWESLLSRLNPKLQLDLLSRLIGQNPPTRNHWRSLFEVVDYDLRTSWHYRGTLLIATMLSIIAVANLGVKAYTHPEDALNVGSFGFTTTIILVFWLALWQGIEVSLEPTLFSEFGFWGGTTFVRQVTQGLSKHIIWPGIESIYEALTSKAVVGAVAVAVTFAGFVSIAVAGFVTVTVVGFVAIAVAVTFAFAGAFAGAGAVSGAGAFIFAAFVTAFVTVFVTVSGAFAFAGAFFVAIVSAISGAGIGTWSQLKSNSDKGYPKFLTVLAFPWFCWLPIVSVLSTWALYDYLSQFSPIGRFPIWLQTALGVAIVAGVWAALWHRGQWLDARARNPFHGGALGAALGVKRLSPKKLYQL